MKATNHLLFMGALLLISLLTVGFAGLQNSTTLSTIEDAVANDEDGQQIYMTRCQSCHMANGEGVQGVFPPVANSPYVSGDKGVLVRMILHGLRGEIVVQDVTYNGMMPPWGGFLNDEQVAKVTTYIRANFGNDADAISTEEVAKIRAFVGERKDAWTWEELSQEENQGIPDGE